MWPKGVLYDDAEQRSPVPRSDTAASSAKALPSKDQAKVWQGYTLGTNTKNSSRFSGGRPDQTHKGQPDSQEINQVDKNFVDLPKVSAKDVSAFDLHR
jgi:hypothetical protein